MFPRTLVVLTIALLSTAHALNNGMGLKPPLGWSTWCSNGPCGNDYCDEATIASAAHAMRVNGMFEAGYRWIVLDDCWAAGERTANGTLTWDLKRFPSGMPALIERMHKLNFSFGLYTSAGNATCSSGGRGYPIPGSEGHFVADSDTFALWGVDYVKVDWCGDVHNLPLDGIAVGAKYYTEFSKALTTSSPPRPMYFEAVAAYLFLMSETPKYVNAWRASTDHHDDWLNLIEVLAFVEALGTPGAPGAWSYMDVLMTGGQGCRKHSSAHCPGMTAEEYLTEFALWSIYQSPLIVASDVRNMTAVMNATLLNREILRFHQSTETPPGRHVGGDDSCGELGRLTCQFFTRMVTGGWLVVLFNAGSDAHTIKFPLSLIGGNGTARAVVKDLYNDRKMVVARDIVLPTPSHGVQYLFVSM